jgi:hypothetical protein
MTELGLEGYARGSFELPYRAGGERFVNLVGRLPGSDPALAPVLLAAHYDTCGPLPGADDNAAALAILLSVIGRLRERRLTRSILFAFFDAEEPPHFLSSTMGSKVFYHRQRAEPIHCAVVLDLVGHDLPLSGLEDLLFITGMESDPNLPHVLRACEPLNGIRTVPALNRYVGDMSDHHVFRVAGRPYLFLSCGRWEHYHRASDTPDRLNYEKMAAIARYGVELGAALSNASLDGPFEGYDSTPHELYFMRKALGPSAERWGITFRSRHDIDRLAMTLLSQFRL